MRMWAVIVLLFTGYLYNQHFGWNFSPKNDAEIICDMLFVIMAFLYWSANLLASIYTELLKCNEHSGDKK